MVDPKNGYLGVSYPSLVPVLIEAVKEQQREIEGLRRLILEMKNAGRQSSSEILP